LLIALILIAGLLMPAIPAQAIVGSTTDGADDYPYVAGIWLRWNCCLDPDQNGKGDHFQMPNPPDYPEFFRDYDGDEENDIDLGGPRVRATGILIARNVVLTSGTHFRNGRQVGVSFTNPISQGLADDADPADFAVGAPGVYEGYVYRFPGLDANADAPRHNDLAVVILNSPVDDDIPTADLSLPGALDALKRSKDKAELDTVSYGPDGFDEEAWDFERRVSSWHLTSLHASIAKFQGANQYACDGDQGAPFHDREGNVAALLTFWAGFCDKWVIAYGNRLDTQEVRDFLCALGDIENNPLNLVKDPNHPIENGKETKFVRYATPDSSLQSYCVEVSGDRVTASAADGGNQAADDGAARNADRKHKSKHKKGGKHRGKGKHRR
jgi:hypothetical protein